MSDVHEQARGRWRSILPNLGVPAAFMSGKQQACPLCGGKTRARFDDKDGRGTWICNQCGAGNGFDLLMKLNGWDFKTTADRVRHEAAGAPIRQTRPAASEKDMRQWRNEAWLGAVPVQAGDPVGLYLSRRIGLSSFPRCLRYHPSLEHRDGDGRRSRHPAMLALVTGGDGKPVNIHRTYLTADGQKAAVEPVRRMMPGEVPGGAAVRLSEASDVMGVAEGIETAFAASALFGIPVWATICAGGLQKWKAPTAVTKLVVFGDNDPGHAGQAAAYACARSNGIDGRSVSVEIPPNVGEDWNDVFMRRAAQGRAA